MANIKSSSSDSFLRHFSFNFSYSFRLMRSSFSFSISVRRLLTCMCSNLLSGMDSLSLSRPESLAEFSSSKFNSCSLSDFSLTLSSELSSWMPILYALGALSSILFCCIEISLSVLGALSLPFWRFFFFLMLLAIIRFWWSSCGNSSVN